MANRYRPIFELQQTTKRNSIFVLYIEMLQIVSNKYLKFLSRQGFFQLYPIHTKEKDSSIRSHDKDQRSADFVGHRAAYQAPDGPGVHPCGSEAPQRHPPLRVFVAVMWTDCRRGAGSRTERDLSPNPLPWNGSETPRLAPPHYQPHGAGPEGSDKGRSAPARPSMLRLPDRRASLYRPRSTDRWRRALCFKRDRNRQILCRPHQPDRRRADIS